MTGEKNRTTDTAEGAMRIIGQVTEKKAEGLLEVFYNGQWGTICKTFLQGSYEETVLFCKALGYEYGYYSNQIDDWSTAISGYKNQPVWFQKSEYGCYNHTSTILEILACGQEKYDDCNQGYNDLNIVCFIR